MADKPQNATANRSDRSAEHVIREAITPSPYRFTVSVERYPDGTWCVHVDAVISVAMTDSMFMGEFDTEAEARSHAALVLAALHQATLEGDTP